MCHMEKVEPILRQTQVENISENKWTEIPIGFITYQHPLEILTVL